MRHNKIQTTWFLVADGARAKVLAADDKKGTARPVYDHIFTSVGRAHSYKALTDRAGRSFDSVGTSRHGIEPRTDWRTQVRRGFAHDLAGVVESAALGGRFDKLVLVAPPKLLGMLREALGKASQRCLSLCIGKEMTHLSGPELAERLSRIALA